MRSILSNSSRKTSCARSSARERSCKKVIGNAEDHSLMLAHQFGKGLRVTSKCLVQRQLEPVIFKSRRLLQVPSLEQLYVPQAISGARFLLS